MNVLDQILLLEQKVESAVSKISQLQAENDALRIQCAELTNALSAKTELLTHFEHDQGMIENGILKALDRLATIENSVLQAAAASAAQGGCTPQIETATSESSVEAAPQSEMPNAENVVDSTPAQDTAQLSTENETALQATENTASGESVPSGDGGVSMEAAPQAMPASEAVTNIATPLPEEHEQIGEPAPQGGEGTPHNPEQAQNPAPTNGQFDIF